MKRESLFTIPIVAALLVAAVWAQDQEGKESAPAQRRAQQEAQKEVQKRALELLDMVIKEVPNLRLPENRIKIQATAADYLWKHDEKRARTLMRQAIDDF